MFIGADSPQTSENPDYPGRANSQSPCTYPDLRPYFKETGCRNGTCADTDGRLGKGRTE